MVQNSGRVVGYFHHVIYEQFIFLWSIVFLNPHSGVRLVWIHSCLKWNKYNRYSFLFVTVIRIFHSVESPSMVDPQWNILYWGSKWNLHTVCWVAVGCEWRTTSVYFEITYVCFIPSRLPVFAVEPQYQHRDFLFMLKVSFEGHIQNLQKNHVGLKFEWGL